MNRNNWTKKETIVAFNVYCKIPFKSSSKQNPIVIKYAKLIGRSPSALNMKIGNLGRLDPELKKQGISGLSHGSKVEEDVWKEFHGNWDKLAFESEKIIAALQGKVITEEIENDSLRIKTEELRAVKTRVNQSFFRSSVLSAYNLRCCITGMNVPELLVASHIIPWKENIERTNPKNGLCLNNLHDKAFDRGLLTIDEEFRVIISNEISNSKNHAVNDYLIRIRNKKIELPDKFLPNQEFLNYHRTNIFKK